MERSSYSQVSTGTLVADTAVFLLLNFKKHFKNARVNLDGSVTICESKNVVDN
jgi:hypothetical protein